MRQKRTDFGYWMGWYVAFAITAGLFGFVLLKGLNLQSIACAEGEKTCFRDWVDAMGSWAALLVGVPSLLYLADQVRGAEQHHRINAALAHRRQRALAKNIIFFTKAVEKIIDQKVAKITDTTKPIVHAAIDKDLDHVLRVLTKSHLGMFETDIQTPVVSVDFIVSKIQKLKKDMSGTTGTVALNAKQKDRASKIFGQVKTYTKMINVIASRFLNETKDYELSSTDADN